MDQKTTLEDRIAVLEKALIDSFGQILKVVTAADRKSGAADARRSLEHVAIIYPKTRSIICVGRGFFGDNTKYAYLALCDYARANNIACHFLTEDRQQYDWLIAAGLPCLPPDASDWTVADIKTLLSAKLAVLSDCFFPHHWRNPALHALLHGAKTIQVWHGIPIKGIGLQNLSTALLAGDEGAAEILASCGPFDVFTGSATAMHSMWAQQFSFYDYAPIGFPRDDVLFRELSEKDLINVDRSILRDIEADRRAQRPVILYAPTFREQGGAKWFHEAGIGVFADHCRARGYGFYVNLHPAEHGALDELRGRYPSIRFLAPQTDIFPVLKYADALVTDYSSLMFDFLLLDRPLIFYRPDHASYVAQARGMVEEHVNCTPGEVVADAGQLARAGDAAVAALRARGTDPFREQRQTLCQKFFDHRDGRAGERLAALVMKQLGAA